LGSLRSVLAKQVGYQTSFLLSSEVGSRELSGAPPRCGMASLAGLATHHRPCTRCDRIALPIVLIGVPFMVITCRSSWRQLDDGRSTSHHRDGSYRPSQILHDHRYCSAKRTTAPTMRLYCTSATNNPLKKIDDLQCPSPTWRRFCESAIADNVLRNDNRRHHRRQTRISSDVACHGTPSGSNGRARDRAVGVRRELNDRVPAKHPATRLSQHRPFRSSSLRLLSLTFSPQQLDV
jgi:hypothetical protein